MENPTPSENQPETVAAKPLPRSFAAFESVPYRWLISSLVTFFLAMQGQMLIRSLLAWELTHSEFSLAMVNLVIALPMVFGSFIAGAVIDRVERRRLVIISQGIVFANEFLILILLVTGYLEFWHLIITSFVLGVMFPFIMPTRTAMIYELVGRERLSNAMALQAGSMNVARILGPAIIGLLIPLIAIKGAYLAALSLYFFSTYAMLKLPKSMPVQKEHKSLLKDVSYSFKYVATHRQILLVFLFGIFPMLIALPVYSFLVVFADEIWAVGETGLGLLMATMGLGGIIGALVVARLGEALPKTKTMLYSALFFAVLLAGFAVSKSFALALFLLLVANAFSNISQTMNNTIVQLLADEEVRGRMSSLVMLTLGFSPLGVLPIAFISESYGIAWTMFGACAILLVIVLCFLLFSPTLRKLDAEMDAKITPA